MKTLSKLIATTSALLALSVPAVAQDKVIKRIAKPPIPNETKTVVSPPATKVAPEKPEAPEKPKEYVVRSGDNPWLIAKNHGISLGALMAANEIKDAKSLKIGDVLILPKGSEPNTAPAPKTAAGSKPATAPKEGDNWILYTIMKGDNPWSISKALKVDHQKIIALNDGTDFTKLDIGQQIKVPKAAEK